MEETEQSLVDARVVEVSQESDTIKRLVLQVEDAQLSFKPGQWVDFHIPGLHTFTGYSMCSCPRLLRDGGRMELAVKYSNYPPTLWVHTQCMMGDKVRIRVGGSIFYEMIPGAPRQDLLLLAAGIGINPILSIYRHFIQEQQGQTTLPHRLCLLYSARSPGELVFKDEIVEMSKSNPKVNVSLFSTRQLVDTSTHFHITNGRITSSVIQDKMAALDMRSLCVYVCGPPVFIDDMEQHCLKNGATKEQIHYEKWPSAPHTTERETI